MNNRNIADSYVKNLILFNQKNLNYFIARET